MKSTGQKGGQKPIFTIGDIGTAALGYKVGGVPGFIITAGWTFYVKPSMQGKFYNEYDWSKSGIGLIPVP